MIHRIESKSKEHIWEVQRLLSICGGFYQLSIDGIAGKGTTTAIQNFCDFHNINEGWEFALQKIVNDMQPMQISSKDDFIAEMRQMCTYFDLGMPEQQAYIAATVEHETAGTFEPVREAFHLSDRWRKKNFKYYPYYGRGYVQLTWLSNYKKYTNILNPYGTRLLELDKNPDYALDPSLSLFILIHGFKTGSFRNKHWLERHINDKKVDFINARLCINGYRKGEDKPDKAELIATYAEKWLSKFKELDNA